jgi:hypothetical protein
LYGFCLGCVLGTGGALINPGRPARIGMRGGPKQLSPFEQQLDRAIRQHRDVRLMVLANVPLLALSVGLTALARPTLEPGRWDDIFVGTIFAGALSLVSSWAV